MDTATRSERRHLLRSVLGRCGYTNQLVVEDFAVWDPRSETTRPDLVAFVRPDQRDMTTAAIVALVIDSEEELHSRWLTTAAAIAAPALLAALPDALSLWQVRTDISDSTKDIQVPLEAPEQLISRLAALSPEAVHRWKSGGLQVPLFPVDVGLLDASRSAARTHLTQQVEDAVLGLRQARPNAPNDLYPRLALAALAVLMVRDKVGGGDVTGGALVDVAQHQFPGYLSWMNSLDHEDVRLVTSLVDQLGQSINFAGLAPTMVSEVYEQALITTAQRRQQGTYYTPPRLARRLLDMVPIEHLAPERRFILDPACGSGTLLLAAAARLEQLQPFNADARQRHNYLVSHLRGFDRDQFAVEISKLSLLMTALPIGNSWMVEPRDVLLRDLNVTERPSVMVSNPPWQYSRLDGRRIERDFHRVNKSDTLVRRPKVLASAKRSAGSAWRTKVGLDLIGVVPRETMYMVVPKADWLGFGELDTTARLYGLLAVLGSGLFSCWIEEHEPKRNVSSSVYTSFPVPAEPADWVKLVNAGAAMSAAVASGDDAALVEAGHHLEQTVAAVYGLSETAKELIASRLAARPAPEGVLRYPPFPPQPIQPSPDSAPSFGTVLEADEDGLLVWVSGVTDDGGARIGVPGCAMGWMCQPGVDFTVTGDLSRLAGATFGLHVYDWLPEGEETLPFASSVT